MSNAFRILRGLLSIVGLFVCTSLDALSQDTVDVTFYYRAPSSPTMYAVGEYNTWNNSDNPMTYVGSNTWKATVRVWPQVYTPGAIEYKFYYSGVVNWPNDPLNPRSDAGRNSNSILYIRNPVIYQFATQDQIDANNLNASAKSNTPSISAYLYPRINATLDTSSLTLKVDGTTYTGLGAYYDTVSRRFQFQPTQYLANGTHKASISVGVVTDSMTFSVQSGFVQILTRGGFSTRNSARAILGSVADTSIHVIHIARNSADTVTGSAANGSFAISVPLLEGPDTLRAVVKDSSGTVKVSDPIIVTRIVNHTPTAAVQVSAGALNTVVLSATSSADPDSQAVTFVWRDDARTPLGIQGRNDTAVTVPLPSTPGEYFFGLIVSDPNGNKDTTTAYFAVDADGHLVIPTSASNPNWVKQARIYFMFPKAASVQGNLAGSAALLPYIQSMGFNVVWLMPIMKNAYPIDQNYGPGYNIVDFYNVAPEYGTNTDFRNFMTQAHSLGMKVILDITPNHTSRSHPFSVDAHTYHQTSPYWNWYQHTTDGSNTNGLGWGTDADGFVYYGGFGDQLLNVNWADVDARTEMINMLKYWVQQFGVDGFRFDVYWGPHNRYGEAYMGIPMRQALKHVKPDIMLLGETAGTGGGTEDNYADYGKGGLDLAYDWNLYWNAIKTFDFSQSAIGNVQSNLSNGGYWPGPNARYLRFMENQDEDVIFYNNPNPTNFYDSNPTTAFTKTMPMASTIFAAPGIPQIWNGQEIGWGYGISGAKEKRNRSTIGWGYLGKTLLQPHYQKIAQIRAQFPAFWSQQMFLVNTNQSQVYAFTRPYKREDAIVAVNFSSSPVTATLSLSGTYFADSSIAEGKTFVVSDLYNDSTYSVTITGWAATLNIPLVAYGTAIMILSDSAKHLTLPVITGVNDGRNELADLPNNFRLEQNYPNPFNPVTIVEYQVPVASRQSSVVSVKVYDVLGREVATLANSVQSPGTHRVTWNASNFSSGVYLLRMQAGSFVSTRKMLLLK